MSLFPLLISSISLHLIIIKKNYHSQDRRYIPEIVDFS